MAERCKKCKKGLGIRNRSGFCKNCFGGARTYPLWEREKKRRLMLGKTLSAITRERISKTLLGLSLCDDKSSVWKGGRKIHSGYVLIKVPGTRGRYRREHQLVIEEWMGRELKKNERVHHWDEDKGNNKIENLALFRANGPHSRLHQFAYRHKINIQSLRFEQPWLAKEI